MRSAERAKATLEASEVGCDAFLRERQIGHSHTATPSRRAASGQIDQRFVEQCIATRLPARIEDDATARAPNGHSWRTSRQQVRRTATSRDEPRRRSGFSDGNGGDHTAPEHHRQAAAACDLPRDFRLQRPN
jgi:hypothetical protein